MTRFKLLAIIAFVSLSSLMTYAQDITQNSNVCDELETMFGGLSLGTTRVLTGYLLDKAFEVADIRDFDGTILSNNNYVDVNTFRNILLTINSSRVNSSGSAINANAIIDGLADTTSVQLAVAAYKYNYIVSNALADNLITYQGGVVSDSYVNGILQDPFGVANVFAFTPNRTAVTGDSVRYKFSTSQSYGNILPVSYEFDAGNGAGYLPITMPYDSTVTYSTTGIKDIKMRVRLLDSSYLESHAQIEVLRHPTAPNGALISPNMVHYFSENYYNEIVTAKVSVKYINSANLITRPLIYVEGFDDLYLGSLYNFSKALQDLNGNSHEYFNRIIYDRLTSSRGSLSFQTFYDKDGITGLNDTYDIVYVDWGNPQADIRANALLLEDIIQWVNNLKAPIIGKRNVVFGHSMGGLVARYALRDMEIKGIEHDTSYYVSHDSPHLGANVPLGVIYAIRDIYALFYDNNYSEGILTTHLFDGLLAPLMKVLESKAARQMLINYVGRNGALDNSVHDAWQSEINEMGFPKGDFGYPIENLCIVNGGVLPNTDISHMFLRIKIENYSSVIQRALLAMLTRINNIDASFTVYRNSGANCLVESSSATYKKDFSWSAVNKTIQLTPNTQHYSPSASPGLDMVNSSLIMDSPRAIDFMPLYYNGDIIHFGLNGPIAFIPTASALSIDDYNRDCFVNPPASLNEIPFDSYIVRKDAYNHMRDTLSQWTWLDNTISMSLTGPSGFVQSGDVFTLTNAFLPNPVLTTSDSSVATVLSNGALSIGDRGVISVFYKYIDSADFYEHYSYFKHKTVLAHGLPRDLTLTYSNPSGNNYTITAECHSSKSNELLDEMAWNEDIKYIWGIKDGTNSIVWCDTTSIRTVDIVANSGSIIHMKIRDRNGHESDPNDLCKTLNPYPAFPQLLHYGYEPNVVYTYSGSTWCLYDTLEDPSTFSYDPETGNTYFIPSNYLMAWPTTGSSDGPYPDRIIIDNQVIMRDRLLYQNINNNMVPVYCFKLLDSTYVQSVIANIDSYPSQTAVVTGAFYDGSLWVRNFAVTITKGIPIL